MRITLPKSKWALLFWGSVAFFIVSRLLLIGAFPIFNDEAIYLQYSQLMSEDFAKHKYISVDGSMYADWKPPLQYWLGALTFNLGDDPLIGVRLMAFVISALGLLGVYLFARELFGEREGAMAAALYALAPSVLFYNNQFIAETFVFSSAAFVYWLVLRATRPDRIRWGAALGAALAGTALLVFKQSGLLSLFLALLLPFTHLLTREERARRRDERGGKERVRLSRIDLKGYASRFAIVVLIIGAASVLSGLLVPSEFDAVKANFNSKWLMSPGDILEFPVGVWKSNAGLVLDYIGRYYTWSVPVLLLIFAGFAIRRRSLKDIVVGLMLLGGWAAIILFLSGFNEYIPNTAVIVILLVLLARVASLLLDLQKEGRVKYLRWAGLAAVIFMVGHWGYQIVLMRISPGDYIERSTHWAKMNYLKGWPTGFGTREVVDFLDAEEGVGIVFADPQWGNPRTTLEVYAAERYPDIRIIGISAHFFSAEETARLRELAREAAPVRFAIFSASTDEIREPWKKNVEAELCRENRREVKEHEGQTPLVICRF